VQVPQEATLRETPQLSLPVSAPQVWPMAAQNCASDSGVQPHWFAVPPPPQEAPVPLQAPHEATAREAPQLSVAASAPQAAELAAQSAASDSGVQPHWLAVPPPPQETPAPLQAPQDATVRGTPQLSVAVSAPHAADFEAQSAALDSGVQPHCFAVPPPPQEAPVPLQAPQESTVREAPQLSVAVSAPHAAALLAQSAASDSGVQPHWLAAPPPPQLMPAPLQEPQEGTRRETPHLSVAVTAPQAAPFAAQRSASVSGIHFSAPAQASVETRQSEAKRPQC
jgi:hypothetical protein